MSLGENMSTSKNRKLKNFASRLDYFEDLCFKVLIVSSITVIPLGSAALMYFIINNY